MALSALVRASAIALTGASMILVGCTANDSDGPRRSYRADNEPTISLDSTPDLSGRRAAQAREVSQPAPAPAPAPAPRRGPCNYSPSASADMSVVGLAFPTGDPASSGVQLHTVMPREVTRGSRFDFQYHVTNITPTTLQDVTVILEEISNLTGVQSEPASSNMGGNTVWNLGEIGPCETIVINASAVANAVGMAGNCISVTYTNSLCATLNVTEPALTLEKTATPRALTCDPIEICYVVTNPGSGVATNVTITDTLPAGLRLASGGSNVSIAVGNLAPGQSERRCVAVEATRTGDFGSAASASAGGGLSTDSNRASTIVTAPSLSITSECRDNQYINRTTRYSFTVTNDGNGVAENAVATVSFPAGVELVESAGTPAGAGTVNFMIGDLAPGASRTFEVALRSATSGNVRVSASVSADCAEAVSADCTTLYRGIPAILLEVVDEIDPVEVGQQTVYVIRVTNQGSAPDTNIRVIANLPQEQRFVGATGATQANASGRTINFGAVGSLAPGQVVEWRMTVEALAEADSRLAVEMTSDQFREPIRETESTNLYE